jgi:hypothetical protein
MLSMTQSIDSIGAEEFRRNFCFRFPLFALYLFISFEKSNGRRPPSRSFPHFLVTECEKAEIVIVIA